MSIALLATGDEIVHGDTLNTNSHYIARALSSEGFSLGMHLSCGDKEEDLINCLNYLQQEHNIIIITGGLGPTSDDRTRFALAKAIRQPLIEHHKAIEHVQKILQRGDIPLTPGNRQQALFPHDAQLLPNPLGTAMGCYGHWNHKLFILLPGPPRECSPMFNHYILPLLQERQKSLKEISKWLIFGLPESEIAEKLDNTLIDLDCQTGYRLDVPYIEFKVRCKKELIHTVKKRIEPLLHPYLISPPDKKASEILYEKLVKEKIQVAIIDEVTGGHLQTLIQRPASYSYVQFYEDNDSPDFRFHLTGLGEYWQEQAYGGKSKMFIHYQTKEDAGVEMHQIPYRSPLVIPYSTEWLCFRLSHLIDKLHQ
ncbi:competence/damage-inducible protein A [Legionella israelensis]|uniref:Competence damage inducible protein CinA n=1 Tax=Legionella israelensis TaxID=454 RepID=A0A0W0V747_9GAMM|nr:competence/damage-inducible protein A [Legionella israelensis]KTD15918.1 competence damage inducible protein CinA [Legionella israelensis]QBS09293.1 competence/damage-inducible protein A [Legionella israelensis]SCY21854.1 molybdenum cofactor synthesis domain-containing protein [Legionella israelensis DSM 19235]STX60187.1 Competence damage inducible protein CinA [Legionella israelensis]